MPDPRSHVRAHVAWLAMMDVACLILGSALGVVIRFRLGGMPGNMSDYVVGHVEGWLLLFGGILLANYVAGCYRLQYTFSRFNLVVTWMFSLIFALLIVSITSYAKFFFVMGRGVLMWSLALYSFFSLFLKMIVYRYLFRSDVFLCRTAIIGTGERARQLRSIIESRLVLPVHRTIANIRIVNNDDKEPGGDSIIDGVAVLSCSAADLEAVIRSLGVNLIIIGLAKGEESAALYPQLKRLRFDGIEVLGPLVVAEIYRGTTPLELMDEDLLMQASLESQLPMVWRTKRLCDIAVSVFACIVFFPISLLIALLIKASAPRSHVIYTQQRVGQFGKTFRILKFRTMREGAEKETGAVWSASDDARITVLGRILRRFRLDEIPQFVNILVGEMSLVGPRPERPEIVEDLESKIPFFSERENVPPGLTGWAQVQYPYGSTVEDASRKLEFDLYYMKHLSLSLDLQIVLSTLRIVILGMERSV